MKIDVERAELDVVRGVEAQHWPLIDQVVAEVHDLEGSLQAFVEVLKRAGFTSIRCQQDPALAGSHHASCGCLQDRKHLICFLFMQAHDH